MEKQLFSKRQNQINFSSTGKVLLCFNPVNMYTTEQIIDLKSDSEVSEVIEYLYDTQWVSPKEQTEEAVLEAYRNIRIQEALDIDSNNPEKYCILNGIKCWFNKEERWTLKNRALAEKELGKTEIAVWYNDTKLILNIDAFLEVITKLEVFSGQWYDNTMTNLNTLNTLETLDGIYEFDIIQGYPKPLIFDI